MLKRKSLLLRFIFLLIVYTNFGVNFSFATLQCTNPNPNPNPNYPYLILDVINNPEYPRNFRSSRTPYPRHTDTNAPSRIGLESLNISGSAEFTQTNFNHMFRDLNITTAYIVDLRQESHAFLNTTPVSWYGYENAENKNKSPQEIEALENQLTDNLSKQKETIVYDRIKKEPQMAFKPRNFSYQTASTEKTFVESKGFKYSRIYVLDEHAPTDMEIDQFVEFVKAIPQDSWIHFHCHAGDGRTTTFMILYDMIRNADKVSSDDIIRRQALLGGVNFHDVINLTPEKISMNQERLKQMEAFYQYVKDPKGYAGNSWSSWLKAQGDRVATINFRIQFNLALARKARSTVAQYQISCILKSIAATPILSALSKKLYIYIA